LSVAASSIARDHDDDLVRAAHRRLARRRAAVLVIGLVVTALSFVVDVATGPAMLPLRSVALSVVGLSGDATVDAIVWAIRLPVALMALAVGAALGLSGALMQTILNNPLASSYTLGISAGAGFGAALVIVAGPPLWLTEGQAIPLAAMAFAGVACAIVHLVGRLRGATPEMLVLAGIALLFLFQALLSLLQFLASQEALQQIVFWLFGSLQKATWTKISVVGAVVAGCLPFLVRDLRRLTALKLGDERARGLGVEVGGLRLRALVLISVLTGAAVAFVGTIGFIGLVAPHIARILLGEDQRILLPGAALAGAHLLSMASVASKTIIPGTLFPIGIVTALVGVPFFVWLVLGNRRAYW
jgi:iron complex transport system permease protein